jgi:pimeloyl-ACP methyl ester carboxylesterase
LAVLGCLALTLAITGWLSRDDYAIPPGYVGQHVNIDGEDIRYYQTGSGPDVLLIHGLPGLIEDWEPILKAGAGRYRITAYDRPGHGFSSAEKTKYTLEHNAQVALKLVDHLRLTNVLVVGHSYGGGVVLALAARNPPQVKAFVSLGGLSRSPDESVALLDAVRIPVLGRGLAVIGVRWFGKSVLQQGLTAAFSPNESSMPAGYVEERVRLFLRTKVAMTWFREAGNLSRDFEILEPRYPGIAKPIYLIHGDSDKLVPLDHSVRFQKTQRAAELTILTNTCHVIQAVHPEAILSAIDALEK